MSSRNVSVWDSTELIRAELFSAERLEQHAESLAAAQRVSAKRITVRPLPARLRDNGRVLLDAYRGIAKAIGEGRAITPAAEWLVDNYHVIEEQIRQISEDMPPGYYRQLPKLAEGPLAGYPRVLGVAWAFVAHTDSRFDAPLLCRFLRAYQHIQPLTIGELWAVAITLRIVLVENLRRAAERIASGRAARQQADWLADRLLQEPLADVLQEWNSVPLSTTFAVQLLQRLRDQDPKVTPALTWLEGRLAAQETTADAAVRDEHQRQGASNVTVRNVITGMRAISAVDWADLFESVSLVDTVLGQSAGFAQMDFPTRDRYRRAIEELARGSKHTEREIARLAVAAAHENDSQRRRDPGYVLIAGGRRAFERSLGFKPPLHSWVERLSASAGIRGYIASITFAAAVILTLPLLALLSAGFGGWTLGVLALLGFIPAVDAAMALVNSSVASRFGAKSLPALELKDGIPEELRTLVVVPTLLTTREALAEQLEQLEIHHLASLDGDICFALLSDWTDAASESVAGDDALLREAAEGIAELNRRYGPAPAGARFLLLHRRRVWNPIQRQWMGWERKRGKLHELNRLLRGASDTSFMSADGAPPVFPSGVRYVVTLDADTRLPRDTVRRLVGKMAHPLNRPRFQSRSGRVIEGYAILQPRVALSLPIGREGSPFQRLFSSASGIDPYAAAVSDVYQDLCGEGSYVGKGIYDVDAFESALAGRVPESALLSHDLFEGIFARAGLVSDIEVVEEYPSRYDVAAARAHRWARGDWQLLPWIFGRQVASADRRRSVIPLIGLWKMLDNLRRTLLAPAIVIALLIGWALPLRSAAIWTLFLLATLFIPTLPSLLAGIIPRRSGISKRSHLRALYADGRLALSQTALHVVFLAHQACLMGDAILRTLFRLFVSHRRLLEWVTAAQTQLGARLDLAGFYRQMGGAVAIGVLVITLSLAGYLSAAIAIPFALLWIFSPAIARWVSRPPKATSQAAVSDADARALHLVARRAWRYFDRFVTAADHWLPPDNFQEDPQPVVAHRTSPTNIGLYLLSTVAARDFGWIDTAAMAERLEATLAQMIRLERFNGHFYNWYDTHDLRPLEPKYVSSVDSGNLAAHLIALANACCEPGGHSEALKQRLIALAQAARTLAEGMRFDFLFDRERKLLSIGYRVLEGSLDPSCYDLLASEARLASFVAIANGDLPARHWFRLGRAVTPIERGAALVSWSGSMFEYLMPSLVMRAPAGSLLEQTNRLIVQRQQAYGEELQVPWGISESAYNARDLEFTYQYSSFGVPGLGLKRGLAENIVVAPYATALAAMVEPRAATLNFARLTRIGAQGRYGFYEALDFTPRRLPSGEAVAVVRAYMAHHQGMTIVALANTLLNGIMRDRFHCEPRIQATELLLQERTPRDVALAHVRAEETSTGEKPYDLIPVISRTISSPHDATPRTRLLSNGRYAVMLTGAGSGYSRWRDLAVTRWHEDVTCDAWGSYIFLRDAHSGALWSAGHQPTCVEAESYEVCFYEDRAEFIRRDGDITTTLEVVVSAESDAEVRRVSLANTGNEVREIELTSYAELVLAPVAADNAHPAFSKLFVQTEHEAAIGAILATRRRRSNSEPEIWAAHLTVVEGESVGELELETDRARFLGRSRELRAALAITEDEALSGTVGTVLDPIFSLRRRVRLAPGATARVAFWTLVAPTRTEVLDLADKHRDAAAFNRAMTLAWTQAQVQLHHLGIALNEAHLFQRLASHVLYSDPSLRASSESLSRSSGGQSALWAHGISGDLPIVVVRIDDADDLDIVRQLLRAFEYWRLKRLTVDLVILNERAPSYTQDLQTALELLIRTSLSRPRIDGDTAQGGVFILRSDIISSESRVMLLTAARVALLGRRGSLAEQLERLEKSALPVFAPATIAPVRLAAHAPQAIPTLECFNGLGGFAVDGSEYVTVLRDGQCTPAPWLNVIANADFGFQVSAEGGGYTWARNSRENQLTVWCNDPVADRPGEVIYVRDDDTGALWGPTASPARHDKATYIVRHGQGYSRFEHTEQDIELDLLQFVPLAAPIKISRLTIRNKSGRTRRLSVTGYLEWVLGASRAASAPFIATQIDEVTGAMLARNLWSGSQAPVAFIDLGGRQTAWTGDRREFLGRNGTLAYPAALSGRAALSGCVGAGLDPCGALQTSFELAAHATVEIIWSLGEAANAADARSLVLHWRAADLGATMSSIRAHWNKVLGAVVVRTPDRSFDIMLNGWFLYQTIACRVLARSAFYQASGAYGFRDQLQDGMALVIAMPAVARAHLLRAAGRQFTAGDVQHWWLPKTGRGVRTRVCDDGVWLGYCVAHYLEVSGDQAVLDEMVPFLEGPALGAEESDNFFQPNEADEQASLFEHCARALEHSLAVGSHGLPLFGTGDWNDGMNRVGAGGKGESVWLAWFVHTTLMKFARLADARNETERAVSWRARAADIKLALEQHGWDGDWYRRGYFDDGTALGSAASEECRIDSIAQSWAVISGAADPLRARRAMQAVDDNLVQRDSRLALLFAPPFDKSAQDPGYIKAYPPGIRENGGQYTHAATWSVIAFTLMGEGDKAAELFSMLNPINHALTPAGVLRYKVEPYVVAADVYSQFPHIGRGGWTWYTGSAAWMYRAALESILGCRVRGATLLLDPCVPRQWPGFELSLRYRSARYEISVENPRGICRGLELLELDGKPLSPTEGKVLLIDDGARHRVRAVLG